MGACANKCLVALKIIIYLAFGIGIPIACIYVADKYDGQCPIQPYIIIYLYVSGAFCMLRGVLGLIVQIGLAGGCCHEETCWICLCFVLDVLVGTFLFCWFIAGSVWVYKIKGKFSTYPLSDDYCNPDLYTFAFAILTAQWVLNALSVILSIVSRHCARDSQAEYV